MMDRNKPYHYRFLHFDMKRGAQVKAVVGANRRSRPEPPAAKLSEPRFAFSDSRI
jgi:hypothetical protein